MIKLIKHSVFSPYSYLVAASTFVAIFILALILAPFAIGAAPDGNGPWADTVISASQGNTKGAGPVSTVNPARSNPESALGVSENDTVDSHFFSLGFGGSITLGFDNPISNGVIVVESTNPDYPIEKAHVEISEDGTQWFSAGDVAQDGQVEMPRQVSCARYVRITDISNPADFIEDTADAYDVDGVSAIEGESCVPTTSPSPSPSASTAPSNPPQDTTNHNDPGTPPVCTAQKPNAPTINIVKNTETSVTLNWSAVSGANHYVISYGTSSGNYQYGVSNTGNVTSYTINNLTAGTTYYFVVYAVNDCAPSDKSNEVSTASRIGGGDVLGASTSILGGTGTSTQMFATLLASLGLIASVSYFFRKWNQA